MFGSYKTPRAFLATRSPETFKNSPKVNARPSVAAVFANSVPANRNKLTSFSLFVLVVLLVSTHFQRQVPSDLDKLLLGGLVVCTVLLQQFEHISSCVKLFDEQLMRIHLRFLSRT
jgi:hypothetical protein